MRKAVPLLVLTWFAGCGVDRAPPARQPAGPPAIRVPARRIAYDPATFRSDVTELIYAGQCEEAVRLVHSASVKRQVQQDGGGYLAVGEDLIFLPGVSENYSIWRDWYFPGTQDAVEHEGWQAAATSFAERYNRLRASKEAAAE